VQATGRPGSDHRPARNALRLWPDHDPGGIPDFLAIGHVTRDIQQDGTFSMGGTVTFTALTASRLGLAAAIVTRADEHLAAALPVALPGIDLAVQLSPQSTTFANSYTRGFRTQYLKARADSLDLEDVPFAWRQAPIVLLGPLAQELPPAFASLFPRRAGALIAATPQGWLRRWDDDGRVWPTPWTEAAQVLPLLDVLILSADDLLPFANGNRSRSDAILSRWSQHVPMLVATDGRDGAVLFQHGQRERFAAYTAMEVDPTGAGDVFAAAFLYYLYTYGDPRQAVNFANCAASFSIEQTGTAGIPTLDMVMKRLL
jgi:sugar/nucleoside kinase (ribokinase family)